MSDVLGTSRSSVLSFLVDLSTNHSVGRCLHAYRGTCDGKASSPSDGGRSRTLGSLAPTTELGAHLTATLERPAMLERLMSLDTLREQLGGRGSVAESADGEQLAHSYKVVISVAL